MIIDEAQLVESLRRRSRRPSDNLATTEPGVAQMERISSFFLITIFLQQCLFIALCAQRRDNLFCVIKPERRRVLFFLLGTPASSSRVQFLNQNGRECDEITLHYRTDSGHCCCLREGNAILQGLTEI